MVKQLVIDVGNSSITAAVWHDQKIKKRIHVPTAKYKEFPHITSVDQIIYASVVPRVDQYFARLFKQQYFINISWNNLNHIKIALKNKQEIGIDRLVNAEGIAQIYGGPALIIDLGTATTFCYLDKKNIYRGGIICPGIRLTSEVLHEKTAKLPLVTITKPARKLIGDSTITAMESGLFNGYQSMIEGLIKKIQQKHGAMRVIATGGYSKLVCKNMKKVDIIDADLTLKSLRLIGLNLCSL